MKKIIFLITSIFLISFIFLTSSLPAWAVTDGSPCDTIDLGQTADCPYPDGGKGCCMCEPRDGNLYWSRFKNTPCSAAPGEPEESEIYNPALNGFGTGEGETIIAQVIANALKIVFSISGLVLLVMLLIGGFQWMTAGGNKEALANAQKRISSALIGFIIFISVFAIINFVAPVLGLEFLQILKIEWPTP
ncbi:hypothetical protein COU96_00545 [Candidatus Shapirobacteria bacterium CG10_big_fil_rev_8_21_14_0_10_38_14]|uniref:Uncharacterized protein n=1 Tax=Candidatus Shapirobacteria bacterium CG10_big_fil_rev_8_21_14_0_10_38_14 TaxID=1974483 RepID=A0A2M8L631_9BACT|nr:MAG: hypothetical protein COU96_00545 [Candidatus Shapirobacteria bacterium CG10_big_fil_rev_8_21_14_0_10_38_14]